MFKPWRPRSTTLWQRSAITLATLALCSACSLAPTYQRPEVTLPAWPSAPAASNAPSVTQLRWESVYTDARLQGLIRVALERNHDLRLAVARQEQARALWGIQRADQIPTPTVSLTRTGSFTPAGVANNANGFNINRFDANLNLLSFELDFWGRLAHLSEAAKASFEASDEDRRVVRMGLISEVANAYLLVLELQEREQLAQQTLASREQFWQLVQRKRDAGAASDVEVSVAQGAIATAQADTVALTRQRQQAHNALALLVGGALPADLPAGRSLTDQNLAPQWAADLPSEVLLRRPDVRAAESRLRAANANIGAARAAFLPRIQLTGAVGTASTNLGSLFQDGTRSWSFVPSIQQPLFDAGRASGGVDLAQARKVEAVANYEKTLQQAFREVADLLVARDTLQQQLEAQLAYASSQRERLRLTDARYQAGIASQLDWLDAQRDHFTAQQSLRQVLRQLYGTTAQLYKALGGGDEDRG